MPTPFTHLLAAQRFLGVDAQHLTVLTQHSDAFLLGSVVADAHFLCDLQREDTHFYRYDRPIDRPPWREMVDRYPSLMQPQNDAMRAFVSGYVFHLAMDAYWSLDVTRPYFGGGDWGGLELRILMLHVLLIVMDERDERALDPTYNTILGEVEPDDWLPFLPQSALIGWRDLVYRQIAPGGASETLAIFAPRVRMSAPELRAVVDDASRLERDLWAHLPRETLAICEAAMIQHARDQLLAYLRATEPQVS